MEHNSYPTKDMSFRLSDNDISPLHEALRGKTTMPGLSSSAPNDHAHSFQSHYSNSETIPHQLHSISNTILPTSIMASAGLEQSPKNEQERMHMFLTTPVTEGARKKALSLEPHSIESLLQGDPMAILQAHLDIAGVSDPGPIFHDPALHVPKVLSLSFLTFYHCTQLWNSFNISQQFICRRRCTNLLDLHPHPMMTFMGKYHMSIQLTSINPPCPHLSKGASMCQVVFRAAILMIPLERLWAPQLILEEESKSRSTHASSVMLHLAHSKCIMVT